MDVGQLAVAYINQTKGGGRPKRAWNEPQKLYTIMWNELIEFMPQQGWARVEGVEEEMMF